MKPLPYRARRVDNNEWVYGWYIESDKNGRAYIVVSATGYDEEPTEIEHLQAHGQIYIHEYYRVHPDSVSQSTGRKDKNGVEIYGGMSLKSCNHKRVLLISWSDERCAFVAPDGFNENLLSHWNTAEFEIIEGDKSNE